jgi:hypothetical protein
MRVAEVALVVTAALVLLAAWPLLLLLAWFARPPRKNVVRIGKELRGVTLEAARELEPAWWLEVPGLAGHLHTLAVLFKKPQLPDVQRWWDRRTRLEVAGARGWACGGGWARCPKTLLSSSFSPA